ncbi:MAG: glycerophosphodiester phosphodiesterase family protein [Bacteroidales bacterium]|nr:glycerophosphodiester phosphodiesterase family protein [Bacteroidales bacterium]
MRNFYLLLLLAVSLLPVNMVYAQSATEMLDPVKLAQTSGEVGTSPFVIYDVTKGKYVAQGGTAGVRCVLAESGTVFELSGHDIKTYYKTSTTGQLESYLGNGTGDDLYVNLTTAATWTFNAADINNIRLYKLQCGGRYLQADGSGNMKFVSSGGDTFVLISRAKLRSSIRSMYNNNMIDVTALIDNSRFEQKNGGKTEDKSGWTFSKPGQGAGWRWANDKKMDYPKQNDYYHLIGVFDAERGKVTLYRDGVKVGEDDAKGKYMFPKALEYQWYIIGGELGNFGGYTPQAVGGRQGLLGHNVITRLYSWPLTQDEVTSLHNELKSPRKFADVVAGNTLAYNVSYARNILAKEGSVLPIHGSGFTADDEISLVPNISVTQAKGKVATARAAIKPTIYDKGIKLTLPALNTGNYTINLKRGDKVQSLGNIDIIAASTIAIPAIAHRGDWNGNAQNSRASLNKALDNHYYGSETDVWMTEDGRLMVNHDPVRNNVTIRTSTYDKCKNLTIDNGETMPTLDEFLQIMQGTNSPTKLIIEIKEASGVATYNESAAQRTVELVKQYGVEDKVEYISFSWEACLKVRELDRNAKVAFLSSNSSSDDKKTPSEVAAAGLTGIDYSTGLMHANPGWYDQAHKLGLSVNVWTINNTSEATTERSYGADYITANNPSEVKNLYLADDVYKEYYELNK